MNNHLSVGSILCGLLLTVLSATSLAQSLLSLQQENKLKLSAVVDTQEQYYAQQPFTLKVNIEFYRWFARGTRVNRIDIDGALVQSVSNFSTNASQLIQGQTWTSQQWEFRVFPMQTGKLAFPTISVHISVNDEGNKVVDGQLSVQVEPSIIDIIAPNGLEQVGHWVASADYQVEQSWLGEKEQYAPGDAITRVITQTADAVPAMMLTPIEAESIDGLALYRVTPKLSDKKNRGSLQGVREDRFVYTIEQSGSYQLPDYNLYGWDSTAQSVEKIVLDGLQFSTGKAAIAGDTGNQDAVPSNKRTSIGYIIFVVFALIALAAIYFLRTRFAQTRPHEPELRAFLNAVNKGDRQAIIEALYAYVLATHKFATLKQAFAGNTECWKIIEPLMASQWQASSDSVATMTMAQAKTLIAYIKPRSHSSWPWNKAIHLRLNPSRSC